ncbi:hypothetical protein CTEN210_03194 [Chaetoceros tenuissimus]|uniref:Vps72/YL1 C-terminal domain-containing protein n=1 Tax=Chaetoceros tenuissimus TaxID=426638 RepID=A0AAD3CKD8_9STRA|nr:hypothetical protein CTEN210_03194 [Chaetoceros tenuissimus]
MSKRKAWNEAMRTAAGGNLQIPGLAPQPNRATRNKRREKARKAINIGTSSSADIVAYRIDGLEEAGANVEDEDIEEEFDELEEMEKGRKRRRKSAGTGRGKTKAGAIDKRFKPRSLASILIEESGRSDSVVQDYLDAEARPVKGKSLGNYPARKFCPVTGLVGLYTDPKSQICYANLDALEQLRERPPPWLSSFGGGSAAYHDTLKSLRNEE